MPTDPKKAKVKSYFLAYFGYNQTHFCKTFVLQFSQIYNTNLFAAALAQHALRSGYFSWSKLN
jgi:hypothetical protein